MTSDIVSDVPDILPEDGFAGAIAGRAWRPGIGPCVVSIRPEGVIDISSSCPTMSALASHRNPARLAKTSTGENIGSLSALMANTDSDTRDRGKPWLLAPIDLQAIKAAGVTFAVSMLERVIEERARGDAAAATAIRTEMHAARRRRSRQAQAGLARRRWTSRRC